MVMVSFRSAHCNRLPNEYKPLQPNFQKKFRPHPNPKYQGEHNQMSFIETLYLQEQIKRLQEENKRLKSLLEYGGAVSNTMSNLERTIGSFDKLNKTIQKVTGTDKEYKETKKKGLRLDITRGENKFDNLDAQRTDQSIRKIEDTGNTAGLNARKLLGLE